MLLQNQKLINMKDLWYTSSWTFLHYIVNIYEMEPDLSKQSLEEPNIKQLDEMKVNWKAVLSDYVINVSRMDRENTFINSLRSLSIKMDLVRKRLRTGDIIGLPYGRQGDRLHVCVSWILGWEHRKRNPHTFLSTCKRKLKCHKM